MKKNIFACIVLSIFFACNASFAAQISWTEISQLTLKTNPNIKIAENELKIAKANYLKSFSQFLPDISVTAAVGDSASGQGGNFTDTAEPNYSYGANASLSILSLGQIKENSARAALAQSAFDRTVSDTLYKVAQEYLNLVWGYERIELISQIINKQTQNTDMVRLKYNVGGVDLGSLRRVEADLETSKFQLRQAKRYLQTVWQALQANIGQSLDDEISKPVETLESLSKNIVIAPNPDFAATIKTTPEFLQAQSNIDIAKAQKVSAWENFFMRLNLSASYNQNHGDKYFNSDYLNSWNAQISISYPLFSGGKDLIGLKNAGKIYQNAQYNFSITQSSLKAKAVAQYNSLLDAVENLSIRKIYLEALALQAEITQRKYINGLSSYQDWYSIENSYISAQSQFLQEQLQAVLAQIEWLNFLGKQVSI
ncbi:MAG: TolC family protein [Elusimicrobiota bacterium]|jgi:outer membrane protein TolC|nr:TolC family protein [Elusimicrobiota bacterium]